MKKFISCLIMMTMLVSMVGIFGVYAEEMTTGGMLKVPTDIEIKKNGTSVWQNEYSEVLPQAGGTTDTNIDLKATLDMANVRAVTEYVSRNEVANVFQWAKDAGWFFADITVTVYVPKKADGTSILTEANKDFAVWGGAADTAADDTPDSSKTIYDERTRTVTQGTDHDTLVIKLEAKAPLIKLLDSDGKAHPVFLGDIDLTMNDIDLGTITLTEGQTVTKTFSGVIQCDTYIYTPANETEAAAAEANPDYMKDIMDNDTSRTQAYRDYHFRSIQKENCADPHIKSVLKDLGYDPENKKDPINQMDFISATARFTTQQPQSVGQGGTSVVKYTLTYETNGGTKYDDEEYNKNKVVDLNKLPKKDGYVFAGWYLDPELTQLVDSVTMTKDIAVYAAWVEDNGSAGNGSPTPDSLNGDDHFAYIVGYPDGNVRPNANITRAEVATIFFRLLKDAIRDGNLQYENSYDDVINGDWFNCAISTMTKLGIVNGRTAVEFDPNADITRAEFAAICARFDDSEFEAADSFTDVAGHWAEADVKEAAARGWIRGYEDGSFKPDQRITRAEAMTMINRVLNRIPETADDLLDAMIKWPDNSDESAWYYLAVQEATNSHLFEMKNRVYEKWTDMREARDWTTYEK